MANHKVVFHPAAQAELLEAAAWYHTRSVAAAHDFEAEIQNAVSEIAEAPNRWPLGYEGTRKFTLPIFPFTIFYRIENESVEILAIAHHRRRPGFWTKR